MKCLCLPLLALSLFSCNVVPRVDVMPGYGNFNVDGRVGASSGGATVVQQDLSALGIDGSESGATARASFTWLNFQLALSGFEADYSGSGATTAPITVDGNTIASGVGVDSSLDLRYLNAALTYDIFPGSTVDLGLGLGVTALDLDLRLRETGGANTVTADELIPIPELALRGSVNLGRVGVFANVGWISGNYQDFDGELLDIDIYGRVRLFGSGKRLVGHGTLGYRYVDTDFNYDDGDDEVQIDLLSDGVYLGLTFSF